MEPVTRRRWLPRGTEPPGEAVTALAAEFGISQLVAQLLAVRGEVSKQLELARTAKLIGSGLEAKVLLAVVPGALHDLLAAERTELATLFIVSQAELVDSLADGLPAEGVAGLTLKVERAAGEKCPRCWNYSTGIGSNAAHPEICPRCATALA